MECKERKEGDIKKERKEKRDSVHSNIPGILYYRSPDTFIEELANINFLNLGAQHITIKMLKEIILKSSFFGGGGSKQGLST